jgi:hypothetical protein
VRQPHKKGATKTHTTHSSKTSMTTPPRREQRLRAPLSLVPTDLVATFSPGAPPRQPKEGPWSHYPHATSTVAPHVVTGAITAETPDTRSPNHHHMCRSFTQTHKASVTSRYGTDQAAPDMRSQTSSEAGWTWRSELGFGPLLRKKSKSLPQQGLQTRLTSHPK